MRANRHSGPPELAPTPDERISEISRLVNTMEKVDLLEFSIRVFGSVSALGTQFMVQKPCVHVESMTYIVER